ncbi:hypothetical protein QTP86_003379 [Hemibagrus guttatus]|nr:hypothetical protein QTP86_003379 [Hemibagrus guttatus]
MYWFRQLHGECMELIVYSPTYSTPDFGKFNQSKFSVSKTVSESGSFTVKDVDYKDSAVYFCALPWGALPRPSSAEESLAAPCSCPPAPRGVPVSSETDIVAPEPSFVGGRRSVRVLGGGRRSVRVLGGGRRSKLLLSGGRRLALLLGCGRHSALLLGCGCRSAPPLGCGRRVGPFGLAVGSFAPPTYSGAAVNIIDSDLVEKHHLPTVPCTPPLQVTAVNNQPIDTSYIDMGSYSQFESNKTENKFEVLVFALSSKIMMTLLRSNVRTLNRAIIAYCGSGVCSVIQNPPDLIKYEDEFAEIKCAHTVNNYDRILWYKHSQDTGLTFMGYLLNAYPNLEADFKSKVKFNGVAGENDVFQPNILWAEMGQSVTINCSHTKDVNHNQMYWYRQYHGESMELIVYTTSYGTVDFGKFNQNKFSANKTVPESGSFTVSDVDYKDSAVYFCAVQVFVQLSRIGLDNWMYWYHQHKGEGMELIVYSTMFGKPRSIFSIKTIPEPVKM